MKRMIALLAAFGIGMIGTVVAAQPAVAEGVVQAASGTAVPGQYLVMLRDGVASTAAADQLADAHDGTVLHRYTSALNGFAVRMSAADAKRLAADPAVKLVRQDSVVTLPKETAAPQQSNPTWGLDRIDQRYKPVDSWFGATGTGAGVRAYVLDTGIRLSHSEFGGRAVAGYDSVGGGWGYALDCHGHGTHVAGTIGGATYGVAKQVQLVSVRVLNCYGSGTYAQIIAGIDWVTTYAARPAVANMSLGGWPDPVLDQAVRNSIASGVTYVFAAGNASQDSCYYSPAGVTEGITVGSTDEGDFRSDFSNFGPCVDLFAPGSGITSAGLGSDYATAIMSGTSMAAPHVAGSAANVLQHNPYATPQQVRDTLVGRATSGIVLDRLPGSPNLLLHEGTAAQPPPPWVPTEPHPVVTGLYCESGGMQYWCYAEVSGGNRPMAERWSYNGSRALSYGNCQHRTTFTVGIEVIDQLERRASRTVRVFCLGWE